MRKMPLLWLSSATWGLVLASCALAPSGLPPAPAHRNGQALWAIVHGQCVPDKIGHDDPQPCAQVSIADGVARGYVVLKDRRGASQYLLMPTVLVTGIEDPQLLSPESVDYFTAAWRARHFVEQRLGRPLAREDVGIAVNSIYGRSQDLLHLHIDCLRADVRDALRRRLIGIGYHWSTRPLDLAGHGYRAIRIDGEDTVQADPFVALSTGLNIKPTEMQAWTLVLVGERFADGRPGFVLLAARADPALGYGGSGEVLLDHDCAADGGNPRR